MRHEKLCASTLAALAALGMNAPSQPTACATMGPAFTSGSFTPRCLGDGSTVTPCPCGNDGATGNGCANSVNPAGGNLSATGIPSINADTVVLVGSGMPDSTVLYYQG